MVTPPSVFSKGISLFCRGSEGREGGYGVRIYERNTSVDAGCNDSIKAKGPLHHGFTTENNLREYEVLPKHLERDRADYHKFGHPIHLQALCPFFVSGTRVRSEEMMADL